MHREASYPQFCLIDTDTVGLSSLGHAHPDSSLTSVIADMNPKCRRLIGGDANEQRTSGTFASKKHQISSYSLNIDTIFGVPEKRLPSVAYKLTTKS